jgi:membrane dipeptidase
MECADPIVEPAQAELWWEHGLRSVMLAHFGHSVYAAGTGVTGPLTPNGIELLKEFAQLGMVLDLSHLCDQSFYQALDCFEGPVIASHNNSRALVPGDRQLSDEQVRLLIERDAVIGSVLDAWMLVPGWVHGKSSPDNLKLSAVVDHIDHVCQLAGNSRHAAIGSDVGGTNHMPSDFKTIADLQNLASILVERGYTETDIDNIFYGNWLRFFQQSLPKS